LRYATTVYLPEDVAAVDPFVSLYKVAAFEAGADDLLAAYWDVMSRNDKQLFISVSMGRAWDPSAAVPPEFAARVGALRCVSAYPTPADQLQLSTIRAQGFVGLSDHTAPEMTDTGALAVAAGATVVERHVRLESCRQTNPDFAVAMGAHQFSDYVARIRRAEAAMGEPEATEAQPSEVPMMPFRAAPKRARAMRRTTVEE
jgi:sialic acid synthase SpsE